MTFASEVASISREPTTIVEIDMDFCIETFNTAPCSPPAGTLLCYNTFPTCRFRSAYGQTAKTYSFSMRDHANPLPGETVRPYIEDLSYLSQEIKPGASVIVNQRVSITMVDENDGDIGIDPYRANPTQRISGATTETNTATGTFWRKFKSRNSNYKNRRVRIKNGFMGLPLVDYKTVFSGVLDNIDIGNSGKVRLTVKGLLQLSNIDFPKKTDGQVGVAIDASLTTLILKGFTGLDASGATPVSQYDATGYVKVEQEIIQYTGLSVDALTGVTTFTGLTRGMFNADGWDAGIAHTIDKKVQKVEVFIDQNPVDIIQTLLNEAGIDNADINTALFTTEKDNWFSGVQFRAILDEPVKIKTYLKELREQTLTSVWQGEDQKIAIKFLGPNLPGLAYTRIKDAENIIFSSRSLNDQEDKRITRASIDYDIIAGKKGTSIEEFDSATIYIDGGAESANEFDEVKERPKMFSRWIRSSLGGDSYTQILTGRITRRFRAGAKLLKFDIELKDESLGVGDIFEVSTRDLLDFDGVDDITRFQVTKRQPKGRGKFSITAADTRLRGKFGFIAPNGHPDYLVATLSQRDYAFLAGTANSVMSTGEEAYLII